MSSPEGIISYHGPRRNSRILPLRSYGNPPSEAKFADLGHIDLRLDNVSTLNADCYIRIYMFTTKISSSIWCQPAIPLTIVKFIAYQRISLEKDMLLRYVFHIPTRLHLNRTLSDFFQVQDAD